jgi:hypothetical protein
MPPQYVSFSAAWFTLSLINAGLAQSKGRSGFQWWFGSLFIGPFATLLIVASPVVQPGAQESPQGKMTRTQAVLIGAIVLVVFFGIIGLLAAWGAGG